MGGLFWVGALPRVMFYEMISTEAKEMLRLIVVWLALSSPSVLYIELLLSSMIGMLNALELTDLMLEFELNDRRLFLDPFMLQRRGMPRLAEMRRSFSCWMELDINSCWSCC